MEIKISEIYLSAEYQGIEVPDCDNENTDVVVTSENGEKYVATFFTYNNIEKMRSYHENTGEFLGGKYFWMKAMVLIDNCCRESVLEVVDHLIQEGDFNDVFIKL